MPEPVDQALEEKRTSKAKLEEVHKRALERFDEAVTPQLEQRALSLIARRFVSIPGAQWEGEWADPFENAIRLEINKVGRGVEKIQRDYNENRIVPDFRPAGGKGDEDSAKTLDGLHRADSYHFDSQAARDNAVLEAIAGGFGATRARNEFADPYDIDDDAQRINPADIITDADQRVFFGPSDRYDKRDAKYAFILTAHSRSSFENDEPEAIANWQDGLPRHSYDWFTPDVVIKAEYYEVDDKDDTILIFEHRLSGETQRWWQSELEPSEVRELTSKGWKKTERKGRRRNVTKYVMSGIEVLKGPMQIAGDRIPITPYYGRRWFVDGIERFAGYVQDKMDVQRLYNSTVSRLAETNAQSPRSLPIFAASQMPPAIQALWAQQVVDRHAYAVVEPLRNADGSIISTGPVGMLPAPEVGQGTVAALQIANGDLLEDQQDGADEVKANVSADALEFAATRVDARSGIYLDNIRLSVKCEGEIYLGMAPDIYHEEGREVETMSEDGSEGTATLQELVTEKDGKSVVRNDFGRGRYKVVVDVTEATATRRDKTVKSSLNTAKIAMEVGDQELAQAALITAVANQDGEGMADLQRFARARGVAIGLLEPTEEETKAMQEAQQGQQPNPLEAAQVEALAAGAKKDEAMANKAEADTDLSRAKVVETLTKAAMIGADPAMIANAQAPQPANDQATFAPEPPPLAVPGGLTLQ